MKKKLVSLIASLSLALGLSTSAISKDYEQERVEQYRQFYKEYHDKDYKLKKSGVRVSVSNGVTKQEDIIEIIRGNNIHDNTWGKYGYVYEAYMPKINRDSTGYKGPESSWYFIPYTPFDEESKVFPIGNLDKDKLPGIMKDVMTLPKELQKKIQCIALYHIDGDSWIMFDGGTDTDTILKVYDRLRDIDEARDLMQKEPEGQIQPIMPTENQMLPMDLFFPPVRYVDENKDGILDYVVELYCTNGTWFDPKAETRYITLTKWFELHQDGPSKGLRKHDKPSKMSIDFDIGKEYEQKGHDITFYDKDHDGYFEGYEIIKKK